MVVPYLGIESNRRLKYQINNNEMILTFLNILSIMVWYNAILVQRYFDLKDFIKFIRF